MPDPSRITKSIIKGVEKGESGAIGYDIIAYGIAADVRAIIAKGWSSRGSTPATEGKEIEFPVSCYSLEKVPHGWLFPRGTSATRALDEMLMRLLAVNAAMHHGGAGTVGASLRAGLPTIIKPWFGDQFFW